jgi:transposase
MQVELEQKIIIIFVTNENMDAHEILAKLQAHVEDKEYALRTVRFWMGEIRGGREELPDEHRSGRPRLDVSKKESI